MNPTLFPSLSGLPLHAWVRYSFKEALASPGRVALGGFAAFIRSMCLALAWNAMGRAAGLSADQLGALTLFPVLALAFPAAEFKGELQADIRSGQVANRLTLPVRLYAHYGFRMLGRWLCAALFAWPWIGLGIAMLGHKPPIAPGRVLLSLVLAAIGAGVLTLERLFVEGCAFWLKETFGINHLHNSMRLLLSGALIPPAALPEPVRAAFLHSPYAIGVGLPVRILSEPGFQLDLTLALGIAVLYVGGLGALLAWQSRRLGRHVFINGG